MKELRLTGIRASLACCILLLINGMGLVSDTWAAKRNKPGLHVESVVISLAASGGNLWEATAQVEILDKGDAGVEGAKVTGDWDLNGTVFNSDASGNTSLVGFAQIMSGERIANNGDTFTFIVTNVRLRGYTYDESANVETAGSATVTTGLPDTTPPSVTSVNPPHGTTNVAITTTVEVTFSEALDPLTIDEVSFKVSAGESSVLGTRILSAGDTVVTFTPQADLSPGIVYNVSLTSAIKDTSGNGLSSSSSSNFTTGVGAPTLGDESYRLANNNSYYPDIRAFTQAETLYVQVRSDKINSNKLRKAEVNLSPWGVKFPLSYSQGTYTGSRTLSDIPGGETTVNITLTDRSRNRFNASTTITIDNTTDAVSYPFPGVKRIHRTTNNPRPLNMNILEVTLAEVTLFVSPGNPTPNPDSCIEAITSKTSTFVTNFGLQVGINGDFSDDTCGSTPPSEGQPASVAGLGVSYRSPGPRDQYSSHEDRPALAFDLSNQAYIGRYLGEAPFPAEVYNAVGGNKMLVAGGQPVDPDTWDPIGGALQLNPRTSVGLSSDGTKLIIIVIDGRDPGISEGVTLPEMSGYLVEFGAHTGMNLDGGGSSTMVFSTSETTTQVINHPSDGTERVRPNHLGIYAAPSAASAPLALSQTRSADSFPAAALRQNYPNPFNPETWIPFSLSRDARVTIRIHSMAGQLVRSLELGEIPQGAYVSRDKAVYWDGTNEVGEQVSSGIYFYSIQAGSFSTTRKMVVQE